MRRIAVTLSRVSRDDTTSRLVFNVVSAPPVYMSFSRNLGRPHAILKHTPETVARSAGTTWAAVQRWTSATPAV